MNKLDKNKKLEQLANKMLKNDSKNQRLKEKHIEIDFNLFKQDDSANKLESERREGTQTDDRQ